MPYIPIRNLINAKEVRKSLYCTYGANLNFNAVGRISLFGDSEFGSHVTLLVGTRRRQAEMHDSLFHQPLDV